jgi:hypothetical protein
MIKTLLEKYLGEKRVIDIKRSACCSAKIRNNKCTECGKDASKFVRKHKGPGNREIRFYGEKK